jgi:hypothetical protein
MVVNQGCLAAQSNIVTHCPRFPFFRKKKEKKKFSLIQGKKSFLVCPHFNLCGFFNFNRR